MKTISALLILISINGFACPNVSFKNLNCVDSAWGEYKMSSLEIANGYLKADVDGELVEMPIPYSDEEMEISCSGNTIVSVEKTGDVIAKTVMTFSNNSVKRVGSRLVWQCDGAGCDTDQYYLTGTEEFTDTCTVN